MPPNDASALRSSPAVILKGDALVPGDKSISHRALMLSSQAVGTTKISGLLEGDDVLNTAKALQSLGVTIRSGKIWEVDGTGIGRLKESSDVLDLGNSGTSTRLLMGLVAPYPFTTFFTGDDSLRSRPMARVITPLMQMGVKITARDGNKLPLSVIGNANTTPITYRLPVASAQVKSAILLAGLNTAGKTTVIEPAATRDHTENMLRFLGFTIDTKKLPDGGTSISLEGKQKIAAASREITVPADPSSAAFPAVAALICKGSNITIKNVCINPLRIGLFTTLKEMGAKIEFKNECEVAGEKVADLIVTAGKLKGVTVPADRAPSMIDEYPILAVAAAFADGETVMHGLAELRVKESDRLAAIVNGLTACGVKARAEGDTLYVTGGNPKGGATVTTHYDHRIAMAFLVLGMASEQPVTVDDATAIKTSFPNFVELMNGLGATITPPASASRPSSLVIAVDGPAASGKGTLARRIAEHFNLDYLDTGSLYRAVGMKLVYGGKDPHDPKAAAEAARSIDAEDLANPRLRQERIGQAASVVSAFPEVREALLNFQRNFAYRGGKEPSPPGRGQGEGSATNSGFSPGATALTPALSRGERGKKRGAVLDGRDIGTVVCPDANFKFFITATLYARAKRRHKELSGQGVEVVFESVLEDLRERDERDSKRTIAPLKPAGDALVIDTSSLDASEVFAQACKVIEKK